MKNWIDFFLFIEEEKQACSFIGQWKTQVGSCCILLVFILYSANALYVCGHLKLIQHKENKYLQHMIISAEYFVALHAHPVMWP